MTLGLETINLNDSKLKADTNSSILCIAIHLVDRTMAESITVGSYTQYCDQIKGIPVVRQNRNNTSS